MKTSTEKLAEKFNDWLAEHLKPARTATGAISKRSGVTRYEDINRLRKLLGGALAGPAEKLRRGDDVPARVKRAVAELVECWKIDKIRRLRRDQKLEDELSHALRHFERSGRSPDGGCLRAWSRRALERLNEAFCTDAPVGGKAARLWAKIHLPPANRARRRRYGRAA